MNNKKTAAHWRMFIGCDCSFFCFEANAIIIGYFNTLSSGRVLTPLKVGDFIFWESLSTFT
jgi:hypothetical protein